MSGPRLRDRRTFWEHLGEDASIQLEPGINQDEVFDDQFERRAAEKQRTPQSSNAISIVPAKQGPWSGNGNLGNERGFAPDENNRQTILKLDEWGFPERWTVMLGSTYVMPDVGSSQEYKWSARAEITVGVGGATQEFSVDWMEGTTFSVVANAILINAVYNEFDVIETPEDLRLRATVCRGACSGITLPTLTETISADAGQVSANPLVRIPPFARSFSLIDTRFPGTVFDALCRIRFYPTTTVTTVIGIVTGPQMLSMGNRIPIPALARALALDNGSAANAGARVIFHIDP